MVDVHNCESFGAALCFAVCPWDETDAALTPAPAAAAAAAADGPTAAAVAAGRAVLGTQPELARQGSADAAAAAAAGGAHVGYGWRLLSGHEKGQVVLWQLRGIPKPLGVARALQQLAVIGEQQPRRWVMLHVVVLHVVMLQCCQGLGIVP
jgi:hypothetical protein